MKTTYLQFPKSLFSYFLAFAVLALMASCGNTKYTASFQKVPAKSYEQAKKTTSHEKTPEYSQEFIIADLEVADVIEEDASTEPAQEFTASLKEMGFSEKKSAKIQNRLEKLNEALKEANSETDAEPKKLSFAEKFVVKKALKKADKLLSENSIKDINDIDEAKDTQQTRGNVTLGLILILAGILVAVLVPAPGAIIGSIVAAVGLILLIIGLLR